MSRFFLPPSAIHNERFVLSGSEAHHALHVLRKKVGDVIDLFDGQDASYQGRIERVDKDCLEGALIEAAPSSHAPVSLVLYQALTRGPKWDWMLEKVCEVGVAKVIPVLTRRSLVKLTAQEQPAKLARWKRIALAASKQCGRSDLMAVESPQALSQAFTGLNADELSLIPYEKEDQRSIRQARQGYEGSRVNLFIGPEGGWDPQEIHQAESHRVFPVRLGPTLLRTETAGLIAAALVLREFNVY